MTLACECGGPVEILNVEEEHVKDIMEEYQCVDCGRFGWYHIDRATGRTELSGCLRRLEP